jgi:hypothetical protein
MSWENVTYALQVADWHPARAQVDFACHGPLLAP